MKTKLNLKMNRWLKCEIIFVNDGLEKHSEKEKNI